LFSINLPTFGEKIANSIAQGSSFNTHQLTHVRTESAYGNRKSGGAGETEVVQ